MVEKQVTWKEFQNEIAVNRRNKSEYDGIFYRGHSNCNYLLIPTLARFLGSTFKNISANIYYDIIKDILTNEKIDGLSADDLPQGPFKIGLLCADEDHMASFTKSFSAMVKLRHLGFPSPILDWTSEPYIAIYFASQSKTNSKPAIFCLKKIKPRPISKFDLFTPELYLLPHHEIKNSHHRHVSRS